MPDVVGYARVSTAEQDPEVQRRRLRDEAGAIRAFKDVASGKSFDRPGLAALLDYARPGDPCASCPSTGSAARSESCS